jgi:asparagine synthase (glutamine-hydrolysing)
MCGIAGILCKGNIDLKKILNNFQKVLKHRGPDAKGFFIDSKNGLDIGLAHTRLSIIDLSESANQPMCNEGGDIHIIFNGEIYNYRELRKKLIKKHKFKSDSDTEVILHLYEEKKEKLLNDLRGMFAFAIWDSKERKLFLARDRFGIKPIYYFFSDDLFIFSSEIKAILKTNLVKKELNLVSIAFFLLNGYIPAPNTIYKKINSLEPGHFLLVEKERIIKKRYYNLKNIFLNFENISEEKAIKKTRNYLIDSIKHHFVSDVPVGVFLSGGIDSSALVSLARQAKQKNIKTISVIFPGTNYDESKYAKIIADKFKTEHSEIEICGKDIKKHINKIFYHMDQPTVDGVNSYFVSLAASKLKLKVALSGLGGDEIFCGYPSFKQLPKLYALSKVYSIFPNKICNFISKNSFSYIGKICSILSSNSFYEAYLNYRGVFNKEQIKKLMNIGISIPYKKLQIKDILSKISFLEITNYMLNQLLRDTDVFSMAHSLEVRVPFVDHKVIECVAKIPSKYKIGKIPKKLLVKAVGNLPEKIIYRKKQGFIFPFELWMRNELKDFIEKKLANSVFDEKIIMKLLNDFYNKKVHWSKVWSLVVLEEWLK